MSPLVDVAEVVDALSWEQPPVLLDVRWSLGGPPGRTSYEAGHLPGASFVDLERELSALPRPDGVGGRHPLPEEQTFGAAMRRRGVSDDRSVVVYDQADAMAAARCWWLLRYAGHDDVHVLDGGYAAWVAAGEAVVTDPPAPEAGDFQPRFGALPVLDADGGAELARTGVLLDARSGERYRGELEPIDPVAGHIPGAVSAPTTQNVVDGRFRSPTELRARFAALGADGSVLVGAYCGSGVTAAHELLALDIVGIGGALYVGSWSDWITDPTRPVARSQ